MTSSLEALATQVVATLANTQQTLCTAESCTGGWVAKAITDIAGSSAVLELGFVTYSNAAKAAQLGVPMAELEMHGAVSERVVSRMANGARQRSGASISVAVSGIAGPDGGSESKPVGSVWFAWSTEAGTAAELQHFSGDRDAVRRQAVAHALSGVLQRV